MPKTATKSTFLYDVHPGVAMVQKWITELKPKTGRSLEEWIALVKKGRPEGLPGSPGLAQVQTQTRFKLGVVDC